MQAKNPLKEMLSTALFPVPYPAAFIYHIILGGFLLFVYAYLFENYRGFGYWPSWGGAILALVSFLLWYLWLRKPDSGPSARSGPEDRKY